MGVSPGIQPLIKKPEDSWYVVARFKIVAVKITIYALYIYHSQFMPVYVSLNFFFPFRIFVTIALASL